MSNTKATEIVQHGYERDGYARLDIHYISDGWSTRISRLKWIGDPSLPIEIDDRTAHYVENNFPWPLSLVTDNPFARSKTYVRTDAGFPVRALYWRLKYRARHLAVILKRNVILTFDVWGLADVAPGRIPAWSDIRLVERLIKRG